MFFKFCFCFIFSVEPPFISFVCFVFTGKLQIYGHQIIKDLGNEQSIAAIASKRVLNKRLRQQT